MEPCASDKCWNEWKVKIEHVYHVSNVNSVPSELTRIRLDSANCHSQILKVCLFSQKYHLTISSFKRKLFQWKSTCSVSLYISGSEERRFFPNSETFRLSFIPLISLLNKQDNKLLISHCCRIPRNIYLMIKFKKNRTCKQTFFS